jgi:hypothetical protein
MWFRSMGHLLARSPRHRTKRAADRRQQSRRLFLEGLEDRRLLAFDVLGEFATGEGAIDLALAPVDAGSRLDLVVGNLAADPGSVRLGNADGTFNSAQSTGAHFRSVATGDLTGEGITDIAGLNDHVIVQKGNGDGTFQQPQTFSLPPQVAPGNPDPTALQQSLRSIATGDLNADGKLDLVVAGQTLFSVYYRQYGCGYYSCGYTGFWIPYNDGYVNVLMGDGSGGFGAPQVHPLGREHTAAGISIADVNGDGKADVVTANDRELSVLLGNGTGGLAAPLHSGNGTSLRSAPLSDLNGDGKLDVVTAFNNALTIQHGQGNGRFAPAISLDARHSVDSVVTGDVNRDGKVDLVVVGTKAICTRSGYYGCYENEFSGQASVLLGNGLGAFSLPIPSPLGTDAVAKFVDAALADLTGDGLPEVVTVDHFTGLAVVAKNDGEWVEPVELSISSPTVVEGNNGVVNALFTVTLSGPSTRVVSVDYTTVDLTADEQYWYGGLAAAAGVDYTTTAGTLTIPVGQTTASITVPVLGDRIGEQTELFFLDVSNSAFANIASPRAVGTIQDDEPYVGLDNSTPAIVIEGNAGTKSLSFSLVLSVASDIPVTVDFVTNDGNAVAGTDYQATTGTVTFAPGQTAQTFTVLVSGDTEAEFDEYFTVNLTSATGASIGNALGYGNIVDDDSVPEISISDASLYEGNSGTRSMTFTVSLSLPSAQRVRVNYKTVNGTAKTSDNDYVAKSGTITFSPGQTTKTITISIKGDKKKESDEYFFVNLSGASGAPLEDGQGEGAIFNDDSGATRGGRNRHAAAFDAALDDFFGQPHKKRNW